VRPRVAQVAPDDLVHAVVQRRAEQHPLDPGGGRVEDAGDRGQEAEVGHVVGLVQDRDADLVEEDLALAHQVLQAAGAGDDDVHAAAQGLGLAALGDAAEDGGDREAVGLGQRPDDLGDLGGQLAGRGQDQRAGALGGPGRPCCPRVGQQAADDRQREGQRLAGARAAAAEHVAPGHGVRQGRGLDRER
jgi:hypothetical protein